GLAAAQAGDPKGAIPHFRRALDARPGDSAARCNLAAAVLDSGDAPEAARICEAGGADPRLRRIAAYAWQQQGRHAEAAAAYEDVVRATPGDWESWNNLGNVRSALGDTGRAAAALRQAIRLRPDMIEMVLNLSGVLDRGERVDGLGDSARDFESFAEMNRAALAAKAGMDFGPDYAAEVGANAALLTPEWVASWPALALDRDPPPPIFVLGFPRSGTTLLDTLLMNLPQLHVLE